MIALSMLLSSGCFSSRLIEEHVTTDAVAAANATLASYYLSRGEHLLADQCVSRLRLLEGESGRVKTLEERMSQALIKRKAEIAAYAQNAADLAEECVTINSVGTAWHLVDLALELDPSCRKARELYVKFNDGSDWRTFDRGQVFRKMMEGAELFKNIDTFAARLLVREALNLKEDPKARALLSSLRWKWW
jgi:hypothetical protein